MNNIDRQWIGQFLSGKNSKQAFYMPAVYAELLDHLGLKYSYPQKDSSNIFLNKQEVEVLDSIVQCNYRIGQGEWKESLEQAISSSNAVGVYPQSVKEEIPF